MAENRPDLDYSPKQIAQLLRLAHKYRRQLSTAVIMLALDEMERQAELRVKRGEGALPNFTTARRTPARRTPARRPVASTKCAEQGVLL